MLHRSLSIAKPGSASNTARRWYADLINDLKCSSESSFSVAPAQVASAQASRRSAGVGDLDGEVRQRPEVVASPATNVPTSWLFLSADLPTALPTCIVPIDVLHGCTHAQSKPGNCDIRIDPFCVRIIPTHAFSQSGTAAAAVRTLCRQPPHARSFHHSSIKGICPLPANSGFLAHVTQIMEVNCIARLHVRLCTPLRA